MPKMPLKPDTHSESPKHGEPWEPGSHWLWDANYGLYRSGSMFASRKTLETPFWIKILNERDAMEAGYTL